MKAMLLVVGILSASLVSAQSVRFYRSELDAGLYRFKRACGPRSQSIDRRVRYPHFRRTRSALPFAYGSFFYGMSWREWEDSRRQRLVRRVRGNDPREAQGGNK